MRIIKLTLIIFGMLLFGRANAQVPEQTRIVRKGTSNILICEDSQEKHPNIHYRWGFRDKNTKTDNWIDSVKIGDKWIKDNRYIDCQYIEFPDPINTAEFDYFVAINYDENDRSTRTYYKPPRQTSEISHIPKNSKIYAYPNPTKQHLSMSMEKDINDRFTVFLLNATGGQTVFSKQYAAYRKDELLNLDFNLPTGIYLLKVETKDEVFTCRIVIE